MGGFDDGGQKSWSASHDRSGDYGVSIAYRCAGGGGWLQSRDGPLPDLVCGGGGEELILNHP